MTRYRRLALGAGALVFAGLYLSPYVALHQLRAAADARDAQALSAMVDFPAVRDSLKTGLRDQWVGSEPSPAKVIGAEMAGALLGPMVDALITPASLGRVLQGQPPANAALPDLGAAPRGRAPLDTTMGYESFGRFVFSIRPAGSDEAPVELVLRRDGLWAWKLAGLRIS